MTVRSSRVRRRTAALALLVLGAGATAACSAESGAAAVVDGRAIGVEEVQTASAELSPYVEGVTPSGVVLYLVAQPTVEAVAAENGVSVSTQEAERLLADLASGAGAAPDFGPASVEVARFSLLQRGIGELPDAQGVQSEILERLEALDVDVNPRYGELDLSQGGIVPVERPWLVPDAAS